MDKFIVVTWPEIQGYQEEEGFIENSSSVTTSELLKVYGDGACFVKLGWKENIDDQREDAENEGMENYEFLIESYYHAKSTAFIYINSKSYEEAVAIATEYLKTGNEELLSDYYENDCETEILDNDNSRPDQLFTTDRRLIKINE